MAIKFKGDMTKVVAKNKGDMSKTTLRKRIVQQIINGTATITPAADYYTKMLLHFDDSALLSPASVSVANPLRGTISPDKTKVYVGEYNISGNSGNKVYVIDSSTNQLINTFVTSATKIVEIAINSTGTKIYVTSRGASNTDNRVFEVDTTSGQTLRTFTLTGGQGTYGVTITPSDKFLYAHCATSLTTHLINLETSAVTTLSSGGYVSGITSNGTKLYISNGTQLKKFDVNVTTGALLNETILANSLDISQIVVGSSFAYCFVNTAGQNVRKIDLSNDNVTTINSTPLTYTGFLSADGKTLFAGNQSSNSIYVISTESNVVVDTLTGFSDPRSMYVANNKLFVTNNTANTISVKDITSLSDSAQSPLTQYRIGTVATSTTQSKFGGKSLLLNGVNTNKLQFANPKGKAMNLTNQPFCIEGWFYLTNANINAAANAGLLTFANSDSGDFQGTGIFLDTSTKSFFVCLTTNGTSWDLGAPSITTSVSPALNAWFHVALIRETVGGDIKLVYNGTVIGTKSTTSSLYTGDYFYIGKTNYVNSTRIDGYVDDVRVVVGSCPYSASAFVVPTAELTAITNTKVLIKGSTTIKDDSSLNLYTQALGSAASSTVQSKFGGSSIKIASATGDFIKVTNQSQPIALFDRPFTIEGWFYRNSATSGTQPILCFGTSADCQGPIVYFETGNQLGIAMSTSGTAWTHYTYAFTPTADAWHHFAVTREVKGGDVKLYCDGSLKGTLSATNASFVTGENIWIGHYPYFNAGAKTLNGYIDEVRILLDACSYGAPFTPPTSQLSASTNTKLMLNFNSDYADSSTGPSTVTTYGGAVLSSAQSKFGGNSMKFTRSTGSRLTVSNAGGKLQFGSSDFCIETWMYLNSMPAGTGYPDCFFIFGYGADSSAAGFDYFLGTTNIVVAPTDYFNPLISAPHGMTTNKWYHVALSRKGGRLNVFIDGVLKGSTSISGAVYTIPSTGANANLIAIGAGEPMAATAGNFDGYMDDFRITVGDSVYSSAFPSATSIGLIGSSTPNQVTALGRTFEISTPSSTATGVPTMDVVSEGINFWMPNSGGNMKNSFFAKDLSNTKTANQAKTVIASLKYPNSNFSSISTGAAIGFRDSTTGRILAMYNSTYPGNPTQWGYWQFACDSGGAPSITTGGSFTRVGNDVVATLNTNFWIKLVDDGTNYITGYYSYDVTNPTWTQAFQVARTGWLTNGSSEIGVLGNTDAFGDGNFILTSWSVT